MMGAGPGKAHNVLYGCEAMSLVLADVADLYTHVHSAQGGGLLRAGVSHRIHRGRPRMTERAVLGAGKHIWDIQLSHVLNSIMNVLHSNKGVENLKNIQFWGRRATSA